MIVLINNTFKKLIFINKLHKNNYQSINNNKNN